MELKDKKVVVFGAGKSGVGSCGLLIREGARVTLYDGNTKLDREQLKAQLDGGKVDVALGEFPEELLNSLDLLVMSPGVPTDLPIVLKIREMGIPVWGEIELAYVCGKGEILGITGTNGKTTTTTLLGEIMKNAFESVFVVGNIGTPYTAAAADTREDSVIVAELSSFQLESIKTFKPRVSAILNITPDHLNRHHTMEAYIQAKMDITKNQTKRDICVLNYEDEVTRQMAEKIPASVLFFSSAHKLEQGIYLEDGNIIYKPDRENAGEVICNVKELQMLGVHNYENVMAAAAMAASYGVSLDVIRDTVKAFKGVEHRIEFVAEKNGVAYYNDSKGTNPDAAIKGIQAMIRPTILIGGGYDKQSDFHEWIRSFDGKVRYLVLIGATREQIQKEAQECGFTDCILKDTFEEAMDTCVELAREGDAVLLSPACASWGMFPNYEVRGEEFKKYVNALK
ncbi:UDP-N-acetylmuramoyl-L-alanine--D-glutamate ligase [Roseburia hominis]